MPSEEDVDEAVDYWHDEYEGEESLKEFIQNLFEWTDKEVETWIYTGRIPNG